MEKNGISQEEEKVYDRQIRLWGLEAQNRLRNSSVLLVGLAGLGAEVAKNLMLSGLKSLTLMDDKKVSPDDSASQFLIHRHSVGENRARASHAWTKDLNPMVELHVKEEGVDSVPDDYFRQFDLVILTDQKFDSINRVNKICRLHNIKFLAGGVFGWNGYCFSDFNDHTFLMPKPKKNSEETLLRDSDEADGEPKEKRIKLSASMPAPGEKPAIAIEDDGDAKVPQKVHFPSFEYAMGTQFVSKKMVRVSGCNEPPVPPSYFPVRVLLRILNECDDCTTEELEKGVREEVSGAKMESVAGQLPSDQFKFYLCPPLSPVCAIIGGVLGQEAIKAISQDGIPLKNLFLYSALETTGIVCDLPVAA